MKPGKDTTPSAGPPTQKKAYLTAPSADRKARIEILLPDRSTKNILNHKPRRAKRAGGLGTDYPQLSATFWILRRAKEVVLYYDTPEPTPGLRP